MMGKCPQKTVSTMIACVQGLRLGVGGEIWLEVFLQAVCDKSGCFWHRQGQGYPRPDRVGSPACEGGLSAGPLPSLGGGALGEQLFTDPAGVLGRCHRVAHGPRVSEDLVVVPTRHGFVSEEIDGLIAVFFHMSQAVPLVPSIRKDVNADLASRS